jgi:hypothetical protein
MVHGAAPVPGSGYASNSPSARRRAHPSKRFDQRDAGVPDPLRSILGIWAVGPHRAVDCSIELGHFGGTETAPE